MSLLWLWPAGLAALGALLLPLLLHLDRRTEPRRTEFAALRWLSARLRPRRSLRLREWWLLLLRLLLVATVALLFARPALTGLGAGVPWVVVVPGVDLAQARAALPAPDAQWHWLAAGFPPIEQPMPGGEQPLASLLRELDANLPASARLTVLTPERIVGADGERPRLSRRLDWRVLAALPASANEAAPVPTIAPPVLVIRHAPAQAAALPYLRAAAQAWRAGTATNPRAPVDSAGPRSPLPSDARWLVWLAPGPLPAEVARWIERGGIALLAPGVTVATPGPAAPAWRDAQGAVLASTVAHGRGRIIRLSAPISAAAMPVLLEAEFPTQLLRLFSGDSPAPRAAHAQALRPVAGGARYPGLPRVLDDWLAWLAAALFLLERLLATRPRRRLAT